MVLKFCRRFFIRRQQKKPTFISYIISVTQLFQRNLSFLRGIYALIHKKCRKLLVKQFSSIKIFLLKRKAEDSETAPSYLKSVIEKKEKQLNENRWIEQAWYNFNFIGR